MKIIDRLVQSIRQSARYNRDLQVAPACILWPDGDRQWEPVITRLKDELPELFVLGDYSPDLATGPAIWLRCVIAGKFESMQLSSDSIPILYLPGVSRQDLRVVENCPERLWPLAELQYRGAFWSQQNAKDWTILAYLMSEQGGLSLEVALDNGCRSAMQLSLGKLLDENIDRFTGKRLDKDYFNSLLMNGDPVRELLKWLDQGDTFKASCDSGAWQGFVGLCKSRFAFHPDNDGAIKGAQNLAQRQGSWRPVWERFCESPRRYPNIPDLMHKASPPIDGLFDDAESHGGWPQWNAQQEIKLRRELNVLRDLPASDARSKLKTLEAKHGERRGLVWAELGQTPLASALEHLHQLAERTARTMAAGTVTELSATYATGGWMADDAAIRALACVNHHDDMTAVSASIRAVYLPWLEDSARHLQKEVATNGYPGGSVRARPKIEHKPGTCYFFIDGLRFDIAKRLIERLQNIGCDVVEKPIWAAIPSVTATGKPAVTPVHHLITGPDFSADFDPCVEATDKSLKGGYHLKKLLKDNEWQVLDRGDDGDPEGVAWCEVGDLDHEGHGRGWKLAHQVDTILDETSERISQLLAAGWKSIHVVTDHGWLLLPGGLPHIKLPRCLAENTWGRCAALKAGVSSKERHFPWAWNSTMSFALPDGVSCYKPNSDYAHGGLSVQECLTLELTVTREGIGGADHIEITEVMWKGLRCRVSIGGDPSGLRLDLRTHPGNTKSTIARTIKPFTDGGTSSVIVEDDELEGCIVYVAVIDASDQLIAQKEITIGKETN